MHLVAAMKYIMFNKLAEALIERAEAMGKGPEAQAFIARMNKECPTMWEYEKALVGAYADGIMFGNWPWTVLP